jgi:hypothetical protein
MRNSNLECEITVFIRARSVGRSPSIVGLAAESEQKRAHWKFLLRRLSGIAKHGFAGQKVGGTGRQVNTTFWRVR